MKRIKLFSMIELLVGIVVLTIMMAFLINAFTTAERVASTGRKSMNIFEKSNMTLDFMASDIRQLVVSASPRTPMTFTYTDVTNAGDSCDVEFVSRQVFTNTPGLRQTIKYSYDKTNATLSRVLDAGTAETIISNIDFFSIEYYNANDIKLHDADASYSGSSYAFNFFPNYCQITIKLAKDASSASENVQRSFERRIYFE